MSYAILRTAKLKSMGEIGGSLAHNYRTRDTPNADPECSHLNEHHGGDTPEQVMQAIRDRLPEKRRSDAVLCVEYLITASPEHFAKSDGSAYFADAVVWLKQRHGAGNVVATTVHRDETSPHLVAYVVPIDPDGKLNAKHFLGGKAKLAAMQTDFAERVGQVHGLDRGIERSKAKHQTIQRYYAALEQPACHATINPQALQPRTLEKRLLGLQRVEESPEMVAERLTKAVRAGYEPIVTAAAGARQEREKAKQAQEVARDLRERLRPFQEVLGPLDKDMQAKAMQMFKEIGVKLLDEQREAQRQREELAKQKARSKGREQSL